MMQKQVAFFDCFSYTGTKFNLGNNYGIEKYIMADKIIENLKSMSLGDHLEELRGRLILAIAGLFIGMIVCMIPPVGKRLIGIMSNPFEKKISELHKQKLIDLREEKESKSSSQVTQAIIVTHDSTDGYRVYNSYETIGKLIENLQEKQAQPDKKESENPTRGPTKEAALIAHHPTEGFVVYLAQDQLKDKLGPLIESGAIADSSSTNLIVQQETAVIVTQGPVEGFMVYIKTSLLFGLLITSPWVIWQVWAFVSAGLYNKEKRYVHIVSPISAVLFITGALFFMLLVAPQMMGFLIRFDAALGVRSFWSLQKYINMVFALTLVFGVAFQMPIAIVSAERLGLVSLQALTKNRPFVILGLVIVAAMATPPDVVSQISLAIPLYGLYEASILICKIWRKRAKTQAV